MSHISLWNISPLHPPDIPSQIHQLLLTHSLIHYQTFVSAELFPLSQKFTYFPNSGDSNCRYFERELWVKIKECNWFVQEAFRVTQAWFHCSLQVFSRLIRFSSCASTNYHLIPNPSSLFPFTAPHPTTQGLDTLLLTKLFSYTMQTCSCTWQFAKRNLLRTSCKTIEETSKTASKILTKIFWLAQLYLGRFVLFCGVNNLHVTTAHRHCTAVNISHN